MTRKRKAIFFCSVTFALLVAVSAPHTGRGPTPQPHIRPVSGLTQEDRATPPPEPEPTFASKETAPLEHSSTTPAEIDFEPQKHGDSPAIVTSQEPPRGNSTPEPLTPQATATAAAAEPQMGDTRNMDGQKQVYILGFGWIVDSDEPNECITVDGDGDINKMVGIMD